MTAKKWPVWDHNLWCELWTWGKVHRLTKTAPCNEVSKITKKNCKNIPTGKFDPYVYCIKTVQFQNNEILNSSIKMQSCQKIFSLVLLLNFWNTKMITYPSPAKDDKHIFKLLGPPSQRGFFYFNHHTIKVITFHLILVKS